MAAYPDAGHAVGAALDMLGAIERFNSGQPERPVLIKIGIHHGAAIAVTLNDELDYFGQTVNIASRVQEMADAAEVWITEAVWRYPGVEELLALYSVEPYVSNLHGAQAKGRQRYGRYSGGALFDLENGKTYKSQMSVKGSGLDVEGWIGLLCEGEMWHRVK
jgi:hypothetical protein